MGVEPILCGGVSRGSLYVGFLCNKRWIMILIFLFTPPMILIVRLNRSYFRTMSSLRKFGEGTWVEAKGEVTVEVKTHRCNISIQITLTYAGRDERENHGGGGGPGPGGKDRSVLYPYGLN